MNKINYRERALQYARRNGIREYRVNGRYLTYNVSYPGETLELRYTMQFKVDLQSDTIVETKRLKRFDPNGIVNF